MSQWIQQYGPVTLQMVSQLALLCMICRECKRADRWEGTARALAKERSLERAKTRVWTRH
jgi:hypothetical protein